MINIKTMFKGMATEKGKIHYCYIVKENSYYNEHKETFCKVSSKPDSIKTVNYFAKVNCKSCLKRIQELHDYIRVAIWYSSGFFYKGLVGINIKPIWAMYDVDIDINLFPEDLIDKNNIKKFISASEDYISLMEFINQNNTSICAKVDISIDNAVKIKVEEKIWVLKTDFDIAADKKREEEKLLQKKRKEVREQVDEKMKKQTKVTMLPYYMRRRMFQHKIFNKFRRGL